jgi:hypothetical protein
LLKKQIFLWSNWTIILAVGRWVTREMTISVFAGKESEPGRRIVKNTLPLLMSEPERKFNFFCLFFKGAELCAFSFEIIPHDLQQKISKFY